MTLEGAIFAHVGDAPRSLYTVNLGLDVPVLVNVDCGVTGQLVAVEVLGAGCVWESASYCEGSQTGLLVATGGYVDVVDSLVKSSGTTGIQFFRQVKKALRGAVREQPTGRSHPMAHQVFSVLAGFWWT